ncbi:MAG TPA: TetR/AcrR family transcriptional regulator [Yinghuangia sp.]|uniref:TetR/AcrR family transcriptional regulator n=1 Tax=Yinghuangia sp. YIM S10712 TaxID=3436930 RepID=UPI002C9A7C3E|nr:TetR/AcrR family transcriptional regulator [Yinghuangia sp.]
MDAAPSAVNRRGRLTPARERELLQAALDLVAEVGYERFTMAELAKRTQSSTATLYRQWESKPKMVITALKIRNEEQGATLDFDTGSLRGDLLRLVAGVFGEPSSSKPMMSIWHAVGSDKELTRLLREILVVPGLRTLHRILQRGVERGEVTNIAAVELADRVLFGPLMIQELISDEEPSRALTESVIDHVLLPALTAPVGAADASS